ncbi:MAG: TonB-dependent receptor [Comamonadaceae bacterium]|nr:TonB-dependent receptor [Comamonadaceae bacterium]
MKLATHLPLAVLLALLPHRSWAQESLTEVVGNLPEVTVSVPRGSVRTFDVAGSVDRVDGSDLREGRMQAQLSEGLAAVPGLQLQNRYNFAQDLQLSIRGFGARSTFGVRGVRLYVDGIPATLPDGQGQTSNIDIASLDRVEILRGPFSALYGNSSGGVVQAFTVNGKGAPRLAYSMVSGSSGAWRQGVEASGSEGKIDYVLSANRYHTDGWRDHSAATRDLVNGKLGVALDNGGRLTMVFNRVRINAQDPLGLTAEQVSNNPRAAALADQYNTRKSVLQTQAGLLWEHRIDADQQLRVMLYGGQRALTQFQSIPPSAQQSPQHAGGVIDLGRDYGGVDLRWLGSFDLAGLPFELAAGLSYDNLREWRRGYENYVGTVQSPVLGERGRQRRLERNRVSNLDPYAQATWYIAEQWTLEAGVRRSQVSFDSRDLYVVGPNGDDSGQARYSQTLPVGSIRWQPTQDFALYLSAGRGFETPTLNELSYRSNGTGGLNFALRPSVNDSVELGAKARMGGGMLTAAVFETRTRDEIVTATSSGGRTTFQNAGRTRRLGFELGWQHETPSHWRTQVALTWLDARVRDSFCSPTPCSSGNFVAAGSPIPGIAKQSLFASYGWVPPQGWRAGVEVRALSRVQANDRNTASAPGYAVTSVYAGYVRQWRGWEFNAFARLDNVADRRYVGSVIVNEGNARYFEPAPGRQWMVGLGAAYRF